jgi:hypothetical protein
LLPGCDPGSTATPATDASAAEGAPHSGRRRGYEDAGAEDPGGLFVVRPAEELAAGEATEVALDPTLALGESGFERVGSADGVS